MAYRFPSEEYVNALMDELNNDERYAEVAKKWEGDIIFTVEPDKGVASTDLPLSLYMDLWHGECREVRLIDPEAEDTSKPIFTLSGSRKEFMAVLSGEVDAMQAMLTRRLKLQGSMTYMMRNVPTILDFLRVCQKVKIASDPT
jgi:putative sterol carrier protein